MHALARSLAVVVPLLLTLLLVSCGPRRNPVLDEADRAYGQQQWIRAESLYRRALDEGSEPSHARTRLAAILARDARLLWERDEDLEGCREKLEAALTLAPGSVPARLLDAQLQHELGRTSPQEAAQQLQALVADAPNDLEPRLALGDVLLELDDVGGALQQLHKATQIAPASLDAQVGLAEALHRVNPQQAEGRMKRLDHMHPGSVVLQLGFARILTRAGRLAEAERYVARAEELAPGDYRVRVARKRLERLRGELDIRVEEGDRAGQR